MKRILYPALLCGAIVLIASACHKNNDSPVPITFSNLAGTYKITNVIVSNGQVSENLTDSIDQCQKDDLFHFNKDSSFYYEDAGVSCSPSGSFTGVWSLKGDTLDVNTGADSKVFVKSLSTRTLVLVSTDSSYYPEIITTTDTFTRQ